MNDAMQAHRPLPWLRTARLVLRPAREADLDALWRLWRDPHVRRYLWDDRVIDRNEAAACLADALALAERGLGLWVALHERSTHGADMIGCAGLFPMLSPALRSNARFAELAEPLVALTPLAWGQGYASEALDALLGHAVGTLGLARIAGTTDVANVASDRMLRRAGFAVLGECAGAKGPIRTYLWEPNSVRSADFIDHSSVPAATAPAR